MNPSNDGGLGQVQLPGGLEEAAVSRDDEKGTCLVDVHGIPLLLSK